MGLMKFWPFPSLIYMVHWLYKLWIFRQGEARYHQKLDSEEGGHCNTFLDDLVGAVAAAAAGN